LWGRKDDERQTVGYRGNSPASGLVDEGKSVEEISRIMV